MLKNFSPLTLVFLICLISTPALSDNQPHIVYIVADDLGWKDVGYHGGTVETPNLDALASNGVRLERFYVPPYSTQSRASALTG